MRRRPPEWRTLLRWSGPVLLIAAVFLVRVFGDRWWPAMPLLYGPRFMLAPLVLLPLLTLRRRGNPKATIRSVTAALAVGLIALTLLLDFRLPWRRLIPRPAGEARPLSVLTWNAAGGGNDAPAAARWIFDQSADVAVITECKSALAAELSRMPDHDFHQSADLCFLTTRPVVEWTPRSPTEFWEVGGAGAIARMVISVGGQEVVIGGVHLETPREALEALTNGALLSFRRDAPLSVHERNVESAAARDWIVPIEETRPTVVMGDFNLVVESAIYQRWWSDLENAFGTVGLGLGWTKRTSFFGVRIDHVLAGGGAHTGSARVGPELGSDHRPLLAEITLPERR